MNEKGISVIALAVTIVVLVILAGITISVLTGEFGVMTTAGDAKEETIKGEVEDIVRLTYTESYNKTGKFQYEDFKEKIKYNFQNENVELVKDSEKIVVIEKGYEVIIKNGVITQVEKAVGIWPKVNKIITQTNGTPMDPNQNYQEVLITVNVLNKADLDSYEITMKDKDGNTIEKENVSNGDAGFIVPGEGEYVINVVGIKDGIEKVIKEIVVLKNNPKDDGDDSGSGDSGDDVIQEYQVKYDANGGTGEPAETTKLHGATLTLSDKVPARTGYTFKGWATSQTATEAEYQPSGEYKEDASVTLYAVWQVNAYKVTYNYSENGGASSTQTEVSVNYNEQVDLTPTATKDGYTFVGWNTDPNATTALSSLVIGTSDITLYAIYSKDIKVMVYYYSNESVTITETIYNKATTAEIQLPKIENETVGDVTYTGRGWATTDGADASIAMSSEGKVKLSDNATYYASYQATVTGTFNYYTGSEKASQTTTATRYMKYNGEFKETSYTLPSITELDGYTQRGWSTTTETNANVTTPTTANTEFYVTYSYDINVTYDVNGGSTTVPTEISGTGYMNYEGTKTGISVTISDTTPTKNGYTFAGIWNTTSGGTGTTYTSGTAYTITESATLYAQWTINSYSVIYDYGENGGTSATKTSESVNYNSAIDLSPTATKEGYTFVGWNTNKDATTGLSSLTMETNNVTLFAIYSKTVTVTANYYNGQVTTVNGTMYNKATEIEVTLPEIANQIVSEVTYTARGWSTADGADATIEVSSEGKVTLSDNATYYASYETTIALTYDENGGTGVTSAQTGKVCMNYTGTKTGISITISNTLPTKVGYEFIEWNSSADGKGTTYKVGTSHTITDSLTLYAQYKAVVTRDYGEIDIKFLSENGNTVSTTANKPVLGNLKPVNFNSSTNSWEEVTEDKWNYSYKNTAGTSEWANAIQKDENGNITGYFVWIPRYAYKITYFAEETHKNVIGYSDSRGIIHVDGTEIISATNRRKVGDNYIVHPSFINDVEVGGWNNELKGIWVAKYEASGNTSTGVKVLPATQSWRSIKPTDAYTQSESYNTTLNSHMIKNSEWGAVAYLTYSNYGLGWEKEIEVNKNSSYYTGGATTEKEVYTTNAGQSTTGNSYGIYDMSGGSWENISAYVNNGRELLDTHGSSFATSDKTKAKSTEKVTVYKSSNSETDSTSDSQSANYKLAGEMMYGDAVYETSMKHTGNPGAWQSDGSNMPYGAAPFFFRSGIHEYDSKAGIFYFSYTSSGWSDQIGFRPVLCPNEHTGNTYTITLDNANATTAGTSAVYQKYDTGIYLDSTQIKAMTASANAITVPQRAYTVTFNYNGNGQSNSAQAANYTFNGYYTAVSGGTQMINANGYITSNFKNSSYKANTTLNAQWSTGSVTLPTPSRTGYTFAGWYDAATGGNKIGDAGAVYTPTAETTLFAHWTDNTVPRIETLTATQNSITITATDTGSGIIGYTVTTTEDIPTSFTSVNTITNLTKEITNLKDGTLYYVWVKDVAGNINEIKFIETEANLMLKRETNTANNSSKFLSGTIKRSSIESITIADSIDGHTVSDNNCWDVSATVNKKVLAWYEDKDSDGYYEVTIGAKGGVIANTDSSYLFAYIGYNGDDTTCIYKLENLDTSNVTNMDRMFDHCGYTAMTSLDLGENFDTSNVTYTRHMFEKCGYKAMASLDLGDKFDTSNVTDMYSMFVSCGGNSMTSLDLGGKFDTSNVKSMQYMFDHCGYTAMTSLDLGEKFDTSNVINMSSMFNYCGYTAMTSLSLGDNFNTLNVEDMNGMFKSCGELSMTTLNLGTKFDTSNVTDMRQMFYFCGSEVMTSLDLGENFDTTNVTDMNYMFSGCGSTAMTSLDLGDKFDTSNVTDMSSMFSSCGEKAMTKLDLGNKFDTSNVTSMNNMFYSCGYTAMTSLDLGKNFDTSNVIDMRSMFYSCGYKAMTSLDLGDKFDTSNVTKMNNMFNNCGNKAMTSLDLGENFDTTNVTEMNYMFSGCGSTAMTSLDLGDKFDTSNVTKMNYMFNNCGREAMISLDLGDKFDTSNVTNMNYMFNNCGREAMTSLDLRDKFDTSNVTSMNAMFLECGSEVMTSLDLGDKFDTSNVTKMDEMFRWCGMEAMTSLDLGDKFHTSNVTSMRYMFQHCGSTAMTSLDISAMTFNSVTSYDDIFKYCGISSIKVYVNSVSKNFVVTNKYTSWSENNIIVGSMP